MGCHVWTYKKVSSFDKDELNEKLSELSNVFNTTYVYSKSRDEYAKHTYERFMYELDHGYYDHEEEYKQELINTYGSIELCESIWDECNNKKKQILNKIYAYYKNDNAPAEDFVDIVKDIQGDLNIDIAYHNNEPYLYFAFDRGFRVYHYGEGEEWDNADDLIKYLETIPDSVVFYNNGEKITGISDELKVFLYDLFKHNDIFVCFI